MFVSLFVCFLHDVCFFKFWLWDYYGIIELHFEITLTNYFLYIFYLLNRYFRLWGTLLLEVL